MALSEKAWGTIARYLANDAYKNVAKSAGNGDKEALNFLFNLVGAQGTDEDKGIVQFLGRILSDSGEAPSGDNKPNGMPKIEPTQLNNDISTIANALSGGTAGKAVQIGAMAANALANGVADVSDNEGNYLARALLAAGRTNTARQNEMYGPSRREQAAEMSANDTLRRHGNVSAVARNVGELANNIAGYRRGIDMTAGNMALMRQMPLSGAAFDYMGRAESNTLKR